MWALWWHRGSLPAAARGYSTRTAQRDGWRTVNGLCGTGRAAGCSWHGVAWLSSDLSVMVLGEEVLVGSLALGAPVGRLLCWSPETRSAGTKVVTAAHWRIRWRRSSAWPAQKQHDVGGAQALRRLGQRGSTRRWRRRTALSERWWRGGGLGSGRRSAVAGDGEARRSKGGGARAVARQWCCARTVGMAASDNARSDRGARTVDSAIGASF
jgi:hypothetical protein